MNNDLLLVAFLAFAAGYILKTLLYSFKTFSATGDFVQKMSYQALILLGTAVYKVSAVDRFCAMTVEKTGHTEDAKRIRIDLQQQFEDWKEEAVESFEEYYPHDYKYQLKFDDWKGMINELTDIYKEEKA